MTSVSNGLVGKRVYRMSSHAPNRGTLKPGGYLKREMKKQGVSKIGGDGMSDTRSGLAKAALAKQKFPTSSRPVPGKAKGLVGKAQGQLGASGKPATMFNHQPFKNPKVTATADGTLKLPFDYEFSSAALQAAQAANAKLLEMQTQSQNQAQSYLANMRNAQSGYGQQKKASLNNYAGRGTAFSSGYGQQVGSDATAYNNQVNDLNAQNTIFNNSMTSGRNQIQADLNDFLRQQAMAQGVKLDGQAGTLGYGKSKAQTPVFKKKKTKKGKK